MRCADRPSLLELVRVEVPLVQLHLGAAGNRGDDTGNGLHPPHRADAATDAQGVSGFDQFGGMAQWPRDVADGFAVA